MKFLSLTACILVALLVIIGGALAVGPWVMEWYALDPVRGTGSYANGFEVDWIEELFGMTEAEMARGFPDSALTGTQTIQGEDGAIDYTDGVYTVQAGGADIWGTADAFRFTYKEMSGDFAIALKAESIEQTNDWAKIGPMVRQSNTPGSQYLFMLARALDGNKYFQERMSEDGSASGNGGSVEDAAGFPIWLKITRSGDDFTGAISDDGSAWTDVGTTALALSDPVLVGLAVTSHSSGDITTAVASELTIDGVDPEFAGTSEDIGTIKTETFELGWSVQNLVDVNDDLNLSNGIYQGQWGDMSNYVFYGFIGVISPTAQDTVMHVAQDDALKVWINGELAATSTSWTGGATTTNPHDVHLDQGVNIVMVKVAEEGGGDYLNVQFDAEDLDFIPKNGQVDWATSVSPAGKLHTKWGAVKADR
jgi:regulation of enolase protein 1 (concanavalin A-like superfamily)